MLPFENIVERDRWVKALGLEPELIEFLFQEEVAEGHKAVPREKETRHGSSTSMLMNALAYHHMDERPENFLIEMRDPSFPDDLETLRICFEGTTDAGLIIEDTLRYPSTPYVSYPQNLHFATNLIVSCLPEAMSLRARFKPFSDMPGRVPTMLVKLEGLKAIIDSFPALTDKFEAKGFKALSKITSALTQKSQATFDYHVDQACQRKAKSENILEKYLSSKGPDFDTMP